MPIFWLEQKFILDKDRASQVKLALNAPLIGQIVGGLLLFSGVLLLAFSQLRKFFCAKEKAKNLLSKLEANGNASVIKDYETNPLMTTKTSTLRKD